MAKINFNEIYKLEEQNKLIKFYSDRGLEFGDNEYWYHEPVFSIIMNLEDEFIGASSCYCVDKNIWVLDTIAIVEKYSGNGYGKILLDKTMNMIRDNGGKEVYIVAKVPKFFEKYGFREIDRKFAPDFSECFSCPDYMRTCFPHTMVYKYNNKLSQEQIDKIINKGWVIFSTCDNEKQPHAIVVQPSRVEENRMILCNIQMVHSIKNLAENNKCCINAYLKDDNDMQIKIHGIATLLQEGNLYEEIKEYEETTNLPDDLKVNTVIVVDYIKISISEE